jgi:hypothetical protein
LQRVLQIVIKKNILFNGSYIYLISFMENTFDFHHDCSLKQKNLDPCCKLAYIMFSIPWPSCAYWGKATNVYPSMDNNVPIMHEIKKTMKMGRMVLKSSLENDWATKVKKHRVNLEASRRSRHDMIYITLEHLQLMHKSKCNKWSICHQITSCAISFSSFFPLFCPSLQALE